MNLPDKRFPFLWLELVERLASSAMCACGHPAFKHFVGLPGAVICAGTCGCENLRLTPQALAIVDQAYTRRIAEMTLVQFTEEA